MSTLALADPYARLAPTESVDTPFRYFLSERCFTPAFEAALLEWLEGAAPWKLVETDFYEQFEFDLREAELPKDLTPLVAPEMLDRLRQKMETAFGDRLGPQIQVVAHRLDPGQRIGIHNDMREGGETHRLTVQLNRGLSDNDGGLFVLFNSDDASNIHRILRPICGSAIGFAISSTSHHAVSRMHAGVRYTVVYSFQMVGDARLR